MTPFLDCNWQCKSYKGKAVCGSDGKTYKNKCILNCKAKKDKKKVSIKKEGPCGKQPPKGKQSQLKKYLHGLAITFKMLKIADTVMRKGLLCYCMHVKRVYYLVYRLVSSENLIKQCFLSGPPFNCYYTFLRLQSAVQKLQGQGRLWV